jgi:hypothetical protein
MFAQAAAADTKKFLYLDSERDYCFVQSLTRAGTQVVWQVNVTYQPNEAIGWMVKEWNYFIRTAGLLHQSGVCRVTSYELLRQIDPAEFEVQFPPGTRVYDRRHAQEVQYVVNEQGNPRSAIPTNQIPSYDQLTTQPQAPSTGASLIWVAVCVVIGVAFIILALWLRSRRARNSQIGV